MFIMDTMIPIFEINLLLSTHTFSTHVSPHEPVAHFFLILKHEIYNIGELSLTDNPDSI